MNGKGSKPRNCFSKEFKMNYDNITWKLNKPFKKKKNFENQYNHHK